MARRKHRHGVTLAHVPVHRPVRGASALPARGGVPAAVPAGRCRGGGPPAEPTAKAAFQQGERQGGDHSGRRGRARQRQRAQHGRARCPQGRQPARRRVRRQRGSTRSRQLRLLERGGNGQDPPPADGRDDHERAAHHVVLRDGPVTWVAHMAAGVPGHAAVITHHPQPARRNDDAEPLLGRRVAREEIGLLAERHAVDRDLAQAVAAGHMVAGHPDDPLDVVVHSRRGAEQPGERVPYPAEQRRGPHGDGIPGTVAVEHDDVAAMDRPEVVDKLVDQDLVADLQGVLHRRRRNEERLHHEALDEQGQHEREDQQDRQLDPPRHVRAPLAPAPSLLWLAHGIPARRGLPPRAAGTSPNGANSGCTGRAVPGHGRGPIGGRAVCPAVGKGPAVAEGPAGTPRPGRPGLAAEPPALRARGGTITRHAAELSAIDLARARTPITCGQFLAPSVPVVIHRIEPSAGFSQRRFRCPADSLAPVPGTAFPLTSDSTRVRYCAGVSRRSLIRARLPRSDRR